MLIFPIVNIYDSLYVYIVIYYTLNAKSYFRMKLVTQGLCMRTITLLFCCFSYCHLLCSCSYGKLSNGQSFLELNLTGQPSVLHQILMPAGWRQGALQAFVGPLLTTSNCSTEGISWIFLELCVDNRGSEFHQCRR